MIRILLVASLSFCAGCAFLDDELLLDDEEFEESFYGSYGTSGHGYSSETYASRCGGGVRRGRISMGVPSVGNYGASGVREFEFEFDPDDIDAQLDGPMLAAETQSLDQLETEEILEGWHAEFLRAEREWLQAEEALADRSDKAVSN